MTETFPLTALDRKVLAVLQADSRLSNQEIAEKTGSSASSVWRRVRAMEEAGVIAGFALSVAAEQLGFAETVILHVSLAQHSELSTQSFTRLINELPEVLECYAVTGDHDYQLKVLAPDMRGYYRFLEDNIMNQEFVARTSTTVVMKTIKETTLVPVDQY